MTRARAAACLLILAVTLAARVLAWSAAHRFPLYDETDYLRLARGFAARGGLSAAAAAQFDGSYRDDNHNPLYPALLAPLMRQEPGDFPRAKLATLGCALFLMAAASAAARRRGAPAALLTAAWTALSPVVAYYAHSPLPDLLFTGLYALAVWRAAGAEERPGAWAVFGALAGAAWLAKGDGHFLLFAPLAAAVARRGRAFWRSPAPWAAAAGFAAAGCPLLWRNIHLWGDPFHHLGQKLVWLDDGTNFVAMRDSAAWAAVGPAFYLLHHTATQVVGDAAWGAAHSTLALCRAFSLGPFGDGWELLFGAPLLAASLAGMARAWRRGERGPVLAAAAPAAALWLAFAWLAKRQPAFTRYDLPLAATMLPFAWEGLEAFLGSALAPAAAAAGTLACAALPTLSRGAWTRSPLSLWSVPPFWGPTSSWLRQHAPGGYLVDYRSMYSAWDVPPDLRFDHDLLTSPGALDAWSAASGARHVVVDLTLPLPPGALGPPDAGSPAAFLGWPRCFRAPAEPNPLVVYGRDCRGV